MKTSEDLDKLIKKKPPSCRDTKVGGFAQNDPLNHYFDPYNNRMNKIKNMGSTMYGEQFCNNCNPKILVLVIQQKNSTSAIFLSKIREKSLLQ